MARYLVTGGCGFIGAHLTKALIQQGHSVIAFDNLSNGNAIYPKAFLKQADINDTDTLQEALAGCDGCFHLAAIPCVVVSLEEWLTINQTNLTASLNVLKSAVKAGNVPVVFASSCSVYGDSTLLPLKEDQYIKPLSFYGCDKLAVELNAYALEHTHHLPSMGLRFFNVYGPGQHPDSPYSGVITRFIQHLLHDKPATIYGDGEQTRDFIYVGDVAAALIHAMNQLKKGAHISNICTGKKITVNQLLNSIANLLSKPVKKKYRAPRAYDVRHSYGDTTRMQSYGFTCHYDLNEGLKETVEFFLKNV